MRSENEVCHEHGVRDCAEHHPMSSRKEKQMTIYKENETQKLYHGSCLAPEDNPADFKVVKTVDVDDICASCEDYLVDQDDDETEKEEDE